MHSPRLVGLEPVLAPVPVPVLAALGIEPGSGVVGIAQERGAPLARRRWAEYGRRKFVPAAVPGHGARADGNSCMLEEAWGWGMR